MIKRSVSPLIATIILIALTVALGAIIVGWAKGYVTGQISTAGAQVQILSAVYSSGSSSSLVSITGQNIGTTSINGNSLEVQLQDGSGNTYTCPYSASTLPFSAITCYIYNITSVNGNLSYVGTNAQTIGSNNIFVIYLNVSPNVSLTGSQVAILYYNNEISTASTVNS